MGRDIYLFLGNFVVKRYHKRPIDVVFVGKLATALLMSGFTPHAARPARPRRPVHRPRFAHVASRAQLHARPARHLLRVCGRVLLLLTGLVYTVKGLQAIRNAIAHPEDEDEDFLNPDIDEGEEASAAETA